MTLVKSTKDLNHHARQDESDQNMHYPKGFLASSNGTLAWRDADANLAYTQATHFPAVKNHIDGLLAPPTEVDGDIYLLQKATVILDVDTIVFQSGTTVRLTFNGTPDLSSLVINDHARVRLAGNASNNGTFIITAINDGSDFIDITNPARTDGTDDEATDSPATTTTTHRDFDAVGDTDWVKFFSSENKWFGVTPSIGATSFNETAEKDRKFKSTGWEEAAAGGTINGTIAVDQVAFGSGVDTIQGSANLTFTGTQLGVGNAVTPSATIHSQVSTSAGVNFIGKFEGGGGTVSALTIRDDGLITIGGRIDQIDLGLSTYLGFQAGLNDDLTGNVNVGVGYQAMKATTVGVSNVGVGWQALTSHTTGNNNTAIGYQAIPQVTSGSDNTGVGYQSIFSNLTGSSLVGMGWRALFGNTGGTGNTAIGTSSLSANTTGGNNTGVGFRAINANLTGSNNTAIGLDALLFATGSDNIAIGTFAGNALTTGSKNIIIGTNIDPPILTGDDQLTIGNLIFGTGVDGINQTLSTGSIGIGVKTPLGQLHVDQFSTTAAKPVLFLDQADISEQMIEFNTTIGIGNAIEAVGAKTLTTTHFIKVTLPGSLTRYIEVGTIA